MFRFVYARLPNESVDPSALDGLVGVEIAGGEALLPDGPPVLGRRAEARVLGGLASSLAAVPVDGYVVLPASEQPPAAFGRELVRSANTLAGVNASIFVENGGAYRNSPELWRLLEAAPHPRVKVAIDLDRARADGSVPSRIVPTLNLRIGLVRVRTMQPDLVEYAKRLAGIGFSGYVVLDPPAGENRVHSAGELATIFRGIFPAKPVKKAVPAKAAG